jgi:hypothetical protein
MRFRDTVFTNRCSRHTIRSVPQHAARWTYAPPSATDRRRCRGGPYSLRHESWVEGPRRWREQVSNLNAIAPYSFRGLFVNLSMYQYRFINIVGIVGQPF